MTQLRAGFGRADITPKLGCMLVGYGNRASGAQSVHDRLLARALVLEDEAGSVAIVSADLCYLTIDSVNEIRTAVQQRLGLAPERLLVATTHTHSGPHDRHAQNWDRPLAEIITDAIEMAWQGRQPARIGSGYGFLYGYSINRRWLDRPVDPGISVLRVDDLNGNLLGLFTNFACHSVVLGYDNYQLSGDWPGYAMRNLEQQLGGNATVLFTQGGSANINPLTSGVRKMLRSGRTVRAIGQVSAYYGKADDPNQWNIGDRGGGTFAEAEEVGNAFAEEVAYVASRIQTETPTSPLWSHRVTINAAAEPGEHPKQAPPFQITEKPDLFDPNNIAADLMVLSLGDLLLVSQPGEVMCETAIRYKTRLRAMGYKVPTLVSYANGFLLYLPEPEDYPEGGYEVNWPTSLNISKQFQPRAWQAVEPILQRQATERQNSQ